MIAPYFALVFFCVAFAGGAPGLVVVTVGALAFSVASMLTESLDKKIYETRVSLHIRRKVSSVSNEVFVISY